MGILDWFELDEDALIANHRQALFALDELICEGFIKYVCHGKDCGCGEQAGCKFKHINDSLSKDSKVVLTNIYYDVELSLTELYHYLNIAYHNYIEDDMPEEDIREFAEGLAFFRNACEIKCDENGNPIMET